jgi:hypothetical protein
MFKSPVFSIGLTLFVSVVFGLIFSSHFWLVFMLAIVLQTIGYEIYRQTVENALILKAQQLKNEEYALKSKHVAVIECPCNEKVKQPVEIRQDVDVFYKCKKCDKTIKAETVVKTLLVTEPIYFNDGQR